MLGGVLTSCNGECSVSYNKGQMVGGVLTSCNGECSRYYIVRVKLGYIVEFK